MLTNDALIASAHQWASIDPDSSTRAELLTSIEAQDLPKLRSLLEGRLRFGTAGLRGLVGPGPRRINSLTIRQATYAVAQILVEEVPDAKTRGVVVGFDARLDSRRLAREAAGVFCALGFRVFLFDNEAPTPCIGYLVRADRRAAGVVVTASHNPPQYNGYKIYWHTGAQISSPTDKNIQQQILRQDRIVPPWCPPVGTLVTAVGAMDEERYIAYASAVGGEISEKEAADVKIAYTPLHGVGGRFTTDALGRAGFRQVVTVTKQFAPDGHFPSTPAPNPEEAGTLDALLALGAESGAHLLCAHDPDADRLAIAIRDEYQKLIVLSGDQIGLLLADALCESTRRDSKNCVVATTICSSRQLRRLAEARKVDYFETLTGFKWLANACRAREARGQQVLMAYEEALGYMVGTGVWDKDGLTALVLIAKLAAREHAANSCLFKRLVHLYEELGAAATAQKTMPRVVESSPNLAPRAVLPSPDQLGPWRITRSLDLNTPSQPTPGIATEPKTLPGTDAILWFFEHESEPMQSRVIMRPSGTEPKVKFYYEVLSIPYAEGGVSIKEVARACDALVQAHQQYFLDESASQSEGSHHAASKEPSGAPT